MHPARDWKRRCMMKNSETPDLDTAYEMYYSIHGNDVLVSQGHRSMQFRTRQTRLDLSGAARELQGCYPCKANDL